jgi:hypothetical protein
MNSGQINIESTSPIPECDVHLLPFNINHTGPARVSNFFCVKETAEKLYNGNKAYSCNDFIDGCFFRYRKCIRELI